MFHHQDLLPILQEVYNASIGKEYLLSSSARIADVLQKNSCINLTRFMPQATLPINSPMSGYFDKFMTPICLHGCKI